MSSVVQEVQNLQDERNDLAKRYAEESEAVSELIGRLTMMEDLLRELLPDIENLPWEAMGYTEGCLKSRAKCDWWIGRIREAMQ